MSDHLIVWGSSAAAETSFHARLQEAGYVLHRVATIDELLKTAEAAAPKAVLISVTSPEAESEAVEACRAISAAYPQGLLIVLNEGERVARQPIYAAGADLIIGEPFNLADFRFWLNAPRTQSGELLPTGTFLGSTQQDALGTAALLAHDLKSPITVVISSLQTLLALAEEDHVPELHQRLLRGALSAAYRQMYMVSDMIDLARLELGSYELQKTRVDLVKAVQEILEQEDYALQTKGLTLITQLPDKPLWVQADAELLTRVLSALLDNALKFTIRRDRLQITLYEAGSHQVVKFSDSGRSIREDFEQDILRRAPQWEGRQSGTRTSVAMGLPFVYAVAQAHGGDFSAHSDAAGGLTTFTLRLPASVSDSTSPDPTILP